MRRASIAGLCAIAGAASAYILALRPWLLRWGATHEEAAGYVPGDELVPDAELVATRAITVRAPAADVWPWIAQMGQGRGGLYSYDALENLVGCDMRSADRIVSEWQDVEVGDEFRLHPDVPLTLVLVDPGRALVVHGDVPMGEQESPPPFDSFWAFVLRERPDGSTRLLVRERYAYARPWARLVVEPVQAVSFVMSQKMLRGIRDRAEGIRSLPAGGPHAST